MQHKRPNLDYLVVGGFFMEGTTVMSHQSIGLDVLNVGPSALIGLVTFLIVYVDLIPPKTTQFNTYFYILIVFPKVLLTNSPSVCVFLDTGPLTCFSFLTHLKAVPEDVPWQSERHFMVSAEELPALSSKAHSVDHTCFKLSG